MAKIMLVEDDNNLREIYEARLLAEGYEIVAAKDGEEALAMAVKEKPDLIIADIMMPKISGFDMLDILRSTAETKDTKVIVMTALSQAEDKDRADALGADRYLVKSQVTLEDVAKTAREVLEGGKKPAASPAETPSGAGAPPAPATPAEPPTASDPVAAEPPATPTTVPVVDEPTAAPSASGPSSSAATTNLAEPVKQEQGEVNEQIKGFTQGTTPESTPADTANSKEMVAERPKDAVELPSSHEKVIQPPTDMEKKPDLNELLAKEAAVEQADQPITPPPTNTVIGADAPKTPLPETADDEPDSKLHAPGQIIGPDESTPGSDPSKPHDIAL